MGDFPIGAHGGSLQIGPIIQTLVFHISNLKQDIQPYNEISFNACNTGHYWMKIIPTHLFDVVEASKSPHLTFKKLMEFFKNVRTNLHVLKNTILLIFLL